VISAARRLILNPPTLNDPVTQLGSYLVELWDAERSDLITIETGVSAWNGIKAGLSVTQGTAGAQPAYSASSFGGGASVNFDGTDDNLALTLAGQLPTGSDPCELWALCENQLDDAGVRSVIAYGGASGTTERSIVRSNGEPCIALVRVGTGAGTTSAARSALNGFMSRSVARALITATQTTLWVDGRLEEAGNVVPSTTGTRLRFGALSATAAANFWLGKIALLAITLPMPEALAGAFTNYLLRRRRL